MYNTSACQADSRYVMAIELGEPKEEVGVPFTMRFVESSDLRECRALLYLIILHSLDELHHGVTW